MSYLFFGVYTLYSVLLWQVERELVTEKQLEVLLYSRCVYEVDSGEKVS